LAPDPRFALICTLLVASTACSWRDDLDGQRRAPEGAGTSASAAQPPSEPEQVAVDLHASRTLITAYRRGALVIDAGSASFGNYVDGGLRRDWHRSLGVAGPSGEVRAASAIRGLGAELYFPLDGDKGGVERTGGKLEIRFTALSAVDKQLVSVFLNERKLGDLRMNKREWQDYSLSAPAEALVDGENKLRFYFRSTGDIAGHKSAAAFSSFVIGASLGNEPAFRAGPRVVGGLRRSALQVDAGSRLSFHLLVPDQPGQLRFEVSGKGRASVRARVPSSAGSSELWADALTADEWKQVELPLDAYRGQLMRLDFLSEEAMAWSGMRVTQQKELVESPDLVAPQHIILWSVASLRSDRLREEVGRSFRRFVEGSYSVVEAQASVPAAGGAHASAMTGRMRVRASIPEQHTTLAERLREAGYATALISGNGFVNESAGYAQGFDHYDNPMRRQHHYGARTLWRQAARFLEKHKNERTFVHVVTVEPHVPYRPSEDSLSREWVLPPPFPPAKTLSLGDQIAKGRRMTPTEQSYVRALYDACVADVGVAFVAMLEGLDEIGLEGNTAIILAGDHGEELWERGRFGHGSSLYEESLRAPFAISAPGLEGRAPRRGSSLDLHPTILDLVGLSPGPEVQGMSLLGDAATLDTRPIVAATTEGSRSVRWGRYKLIYLSSGSLELYDLQEDPAEQKDISAEEPMLARALRIVLSTSVAYASVWSTTRWGQVSSPNEAFARDQGM
jgi:arylsulfatase A-like enzyme